jgi:hypothetical protein
MLVRPDDGAVHEVERPVQPPFAIGPSLEGGQDPLPDAGLLPAVEPTRHGLPRAVALGEGSPGAARAQDPQDAVEDGPMVLGGTTGMGLLRWEQLAQPLPLHIGQVARFHDGKRRTSSGLRSRPSTTTAVGFDSCQTWASQTGCWAGLRSFPGQQSRLDWPFPGMCRCSTSGMQCAAPLVELSACSHGTCQWLAMFAPAAQWCVVVVPSR